MNKKTLIVTADDFGRSGQNDLAILDGHKCGLISRTSVFTTHSEFAGAKELLLRNPGFRAGVHLDFSSGTPVLSQKLIPTLTVGDGSYIARNDKSAVAKVSPQELEQEFRAQIAKFLDAGLRLSHLDNHRGEIYFYPDLFEVSARLASEFKVPLRSPFDIRFTKNIDSASQLLGLPRAMILEVAERCRGLLAKYNVQTTDHFFTLEGPMRSKDGFIQWLESLEDGTTELSTHPGVQHDNERQELAVLQDRDVIAATKTLDIQVVNYRYGSS